MAVSSWTAEFCRWGQQARAEGCELPGSRALTFDGHRVIAAQALVRSDALPAGG